jgi:4-amino-4-deoxy-L-arabinose transferase-like glycosyltransferase
MVFGFLFRLLISVLISDNHSLYFEHMLIARNLLAGHGYSWDEWGRAALQTTSLVPPLYVYWCAFFQWISPNNYLPMYLAQALIAATGCIPAYRIGSKLVSERTGIIFAVLYSFFPEMAFLHSKAIAESIYLVLILWMIERYLALGDPSMGRNAIRRGAFIAGLISGVAMLFKEGAAIVAMAMMAAWFFHGQYRHRVAGSPVLPFIVGMVIILSPWFIRNAIDQGEFVPLRTAYGINLWIANQPVSAGNDRTFTGGYVFEEIPQSYKDHMAKVLPFDEQDRDRVYANEVIHAAREHPSQYAGYCAKRLFYYIWFVPVHPLARNPIYRIFWIMLLLAAVPGFFLLRRSGQLDAVFPYIIIGFILLYIPVSVLPRYRIVTEAILLLFAARSVEWIWAYLSRRIPR